MKHEQKIPFMTKARDKVTGTTGTVTGFLFYMTGCVQYKIEYGEKNDPKAWWVDEERLEVLAEEDTPAESPASAGKGGPSRGPSAH